MVESIEHHMLCVKRHAFSMCFSIVAVFSLCLILIRVVSENDGLKRKIKIVAFFLFFLSLGINFFFANFPSFRKNPCTIIF